MIVDNVSYSCFFSVFYIDNIFIHSISFLFRSCSVTKCLHSDWKTRRDCTFSHSLHMLIFCCSWVRWSRFLYIVFGMQFSLSRNCIPGWHIYALHFSLVFQLIASFKTRYCSPVSLNNFEYHLLTFFWPKYFDNRHFHYVQKYNNKHFLLIAMILRKRISALKLI